MDTMLINAKHFSRLYSTIVINLLNDHSGWGCYWLFCTVGDGLDCNSDHTSLDSVSALTL